MSRPELYLEALDEIPRLLGMMDREEFSPTRGSFDRDHWSWKFRDFPITMLQAALHPLAIAWRQPFPDSPWCGNPRLLSWIQLGVEETLRRQRRDGGFDSVAPNAADHGVTMAMVHVLVETRTLLGAELAPSLITRVEQAITRACAFGLKTREDYAFISNHQALFAIAFHGAGELLDLDRYREQARRIIARILREQSPDGWYREYEGPDPGYESLGIWYLARYWRATRNPELLGSLERALDFYSHCVHPDGSVGGVYGSRHTALYYPAGFELLADAIPRAADVAAFIAARLGRANVVTPRTADAENLPSLVLSYLEATLAHRPPPELSVTKLPAEALQGIRRFPDAAIAVAGTQHYYAVVNASKGGVWRVFDRGSSRLAYEDAGYLVRANGREWSSQMIGLGQELEAADGKGFACSTTLAEVRSEVLTPAKFLVLRLLNLTVFRSSMLSSWIRRRIIARLITGKRPGRFRLQRRFEFGSDEVRVSDCLEADGPVPGAEVSVPRTYTGIHMGSAKYFHFSELEPTTAIATIDLSSALASAGVARRELNLRFREGAPPESELSAGRPESSAPVFVEQS